MEIVIQSIEVGPWKEICYFISYAKEGWIIDPGDDFEKIVSYFDLDLFNINGIINTHGHFDHIGAVEDIKQKYNVPFYMHSKDKRLLNQGTFYRKLIGDARPVNTPTVDHYLDDMQFFALGDKKIEVHFTPGHTSGSVSFSLEGNLFTGDLILDKGHGRTDLPGANKELLQTSLHFIIENFEGCTIHPGHGKPFVLDDLLLNKLKLL